MQSAVCWPKARKSPVSLAVLERVCAAAARACLEKPARQEKLPAASAEGREQLKGPCPVAGASGQPEKPRSHPHQEKNQPRRARAVHSITPGRCRWCAGPGRGGGEHPPGRFLRLCRGSVRMGAAAPHRSRWGRPHCLQPRGRLLGLGGHGRRRGRATRSRCTPPRRALPAPSLPSPPRCGDRPPALKEPEPGGAAAPGVRSVCPAASGAGGEEVVALSQREVWCWRGWSLPCW